MEETFRQHLIDSQLAAKSLLDERVATHQRELVELQAMIECPISEWSYNHVLKWTQGHAVSSVTEIANLLQHICTQHYAMVLLREKDLEQNEELRTAWARLKLLDSLGILNRDDQPMIDAFRKLFEGTSQDEREQ